jgi:hypothetical protein
MKTKTIVAGMCAVVVYGLTVGIAWDQIRSREKELVELRGKVLNLTKSTRALTNSADREQDYLNLYMDRSARLLKLQGDLTIEYSRRNEELLAKRDEIKRRPDADPLSPEQIRKVMDMITVAEQMESHKKQWEVLEGSFSKPDAGAERAGWRSDLPSPISER